MKRGIAHLLTAFALLASGLSLAAHHSFAAQYDSRKPITVTGSVTRLECQPARLFLH